ncbi:MAG: ABC transporter substrate-binding protein [Clostridia bacterium]|nr:ABC transporter substrate-binding protein [Clostridia bacterium]
MKIRVLALILSIVLCLGMVGMIASCGKTNYAENNTKIKIGASGPLTGGAAMYGIAVKNSAQLAVDEINAKGGLNGIMFELVMLDDKHDANNISTNYASLYEGGMQVSLGTVTTKPGLEFKGYANADNVFFLTPSATGDDIPEFANGYQMCFADSDQGTASANVFNKDYKGKKVGIFFKADDDYSVGIKNNFVKALDASFGTPVMASFTDATASSFTQQVSELKDCDVIFMPIYYDPAALFMKQGNGTVKADAIYYGCDGLDGIDAVDGFDIKSITQGVSYLSHFNSNTTEGAAKTYIDAYKAKYNDAPLNQFGAAAYDCVYAIYDAMKYATEKNGAEITATIAPEDLCDVLKSVFDSKDFQFRGITGAPEEDGKSIITWTDANGNATNGHVNKAPVSYTVKEVTSAQ